MKKFASILSLFTVLVASILFSANLIGAPPQTSAPLKPAVMPVTIPIPKFIIGVWYQPVSSFDYWKDLGINTLIGLELQGGQVTAEQYIAAAHSKHFIVVGNHPLADVWCQVDEPDGVGNLTPDQIVAAYAGFKAQGDRPVFLNLDGVKTQWRPASDYVTYVKGGDWVGFDNYVINRGSGPAAIADLGTLLDKVTTWAGADASKKRKLLAIECSNQKLGVQDWLHTKENQPQGEIWAAAMRPPTPDEMAAEVDVAVAHGCTGIFYFPDVIGKSWESFDGTTPEIRARMKIVNGKLNTTYNTVIPTPTTVPSVLPDQLIINGVTYKKAA